MCTALKRISQAAVQSHNRMTASGALLTRTRPPETPPAASAFWGIATIRDGVISENATLKDKGVKFRKKPL
jgi:hypothetical protein